MKELVERSVPVESRFAVGDGQGQSSAQSVGFAVLCWVGLDLCARTLDPRERAASLSLSGSRATTALVSVSGLPPLFVHFYRQPRRESVLRWSIF